MMLVVIPTYNERANIETLLREVLQHDWLHALVVDDNSPDKTAQLVQILQESEYNGRLFLLQRAGKLGLGSAYLAGFTWALQRSYEAVFEMDADFSHHPAYLPFFRAEILQGADLVLGSRYVNKGGVKNWGLGRRILSRGGSLYARAILNLPFQDLTGGFKCFKRQVLEALDFEQIKSTGYSFQIELTYRAWQKGFQIKEIPIVFEDRILGSSKMDKKIFLEAVLMVWLLRFSAK